MANETILITGGAGFIGSHLVRALLDHEHAVTILTRPTTDLSRIKDLLPKLTIVQADMTNADQLTAAVRSIEPSGIFHLAASNIQSGKAAGIAELFQANVVGLHTLLNASKDLPYRFFVQTGSYLEYGKRETAIKETERCEPCEPYALSKLSATLLAQAHGKQHNKPIVTFRIFSPYGPGMQRGRLARQVIENALRGEPIRLTQSWVARDFIHTTDIVNLLMESMDNAASYGGEIFNLGSAKSTSLEEYVARVLAQTQSKSPVEWNAFPPVLYDTRHSQADLQTVYDRFTWRPSVTLSQGIGGMIDWISTLPHAKA